MFYNYRFRYKYKDKDKYICKYKYNEGGLGHLRGEATGVDPLSCQLTCARSCAQNTKSWKHKKNTELVRIDNRSKVPVF